MNIKICYGLITAISFAAPSFAQTFKLISPDEKKVVEISNTNGLRYTVSSDGLTIIHPSSLGFEFKDEPSIGTDLTVTDHVEHSVNQTWVPVVKTKHSTIANRYNELELSLVEKSGQMRRMNVCFRAYDDGVAFRYELFGADKIGDRQLVKELTSFNLPANAKAWVADYGSYTTSQETEFQPKNLNHITEKTIAGLPLLIELDRRHYAAITEANIDNYPGLYIGSLKTDTGATDKIDLVTKLSPLPGENENGVKARFTNNQLTPWRVIMLGGSPGKLIESELIQNLNPPCALKETTWIKPGMSAWDNWWSGDVKMDMPTIKKYIDLASAQHWPYMLIDWQWYGPFNKPEADITKPVPQLNMPEILAYAKAKKVKCWLWLYSSDVNRNDNFEKAFPIYERWGIAGVKIDFMDRDDQQMVNWYRRIIKAAAQYHLMVDFHGAFKPDGIERTYPNMITREGVLGEEYSKFSTRITAGHNTTLPFTRMLAGPMDYTPGGFLNVKKEAFKKGNPTEVMNSRCAELAKFVIYESPFTVYCDAPEHILGQPGADFLNHIPTVWDDTKVLGGYPGQYIIIAKRSGNDWYIGIMTNDTERKLQLKMDFLPSGKYTLSSWADVLSSPQSLTRSEKKVTASSVINIHLDTAGGWVAKITPNN
ncbi:glycoside hydrolase family 97 protein [Mucilaginibacter sabulilitoris]|uniref:Glycoside hydrolase family 97 protein n=1 Tax=Mucilaginibacter sabulilitoris TaxID=1173583 RepID=A0ABZ0TRZ8_9SPHI|nr:glycoside hydrolase family 97 protein [Mucilaginibacter sabulilitoris]WPU94848.1 glycoside hydrolase family 97 protein [Mucilaginibacter sabulilitoris]